jgi:ferric-dicitrate binding protein FerR (iron transport regulator)
MGHGEFSVSRVRELAVSPVGVRWRARRKAREFAFLAQAEPAWSALRRRARYDEDRLSTMKRKATTRKAKTRGGNLLVILGVALVVLLLLLRMIAFVAHMRRHY